MMRQYRILTLDFPRIGRKGSKDQKKGNKGYSVKTEPGKRSMEHGQEGRSKENWVCLKPLQFKGQEHNRSKSYSGSLAVSLASRVNRVKNASYLSKIALRTKDSQPGDSGMHSQTLGGRVVGGVKLILTSTHKNGRNHQVNIPSVSNPKRQTLKIDRLNQRN